MSTSETRTLARSGAVLLAASLLRWGFVWSTPDTPVVPRAEDALPGVMSMNDSALARERRKRRPLEPGERIDLNRADSLDLQRLPRVGPRMAERILSRRAEIGRFTTWDDLDAVSGIGSATLERLKPHLVPLGASGGPVPAEVEKERSIRNRRTLVPINSAGAEDLVGLPGIGPALADRIVLFRREHGAFSSIEDLVEVPGIGAKTMGRLRGHVTVRR